MGAPNNQWDLGTLELNGRDGDTARQAGEKYNLHVHQTTDVQAAIDGAAAPSGANVFVTTGVLADYALTAGLGLAAFEDMGLDVGELVQLEDVGGGTPGLPAVDGSQLVNLPNSGGNLADWANGLPVEDSADWIDAATLGSLVSTFKENRPIGVRIRTDLESDGVTPVAGDRTQGLVRAIGAGNFRVAIRYRLDRPGLLMSALSSVLSGGPVFVDGNDLGTSSWYGVHQYYSAHNAFTAATYRFETEAGADRFDAEAGQYTFAAILNGGAGGESMGLVHFDAFLERTGTDLVMYMGPAGGPPEKVAAWTVTAGAGYIGLRLQIQIGSLDTIQAVIIAYKDDLAELPW